MRIEYPITFVYYKDLAPAIDFYQKTLGLPLAIDQGWCKIYAVGPAGYLGLVDESRGSLRATPDKAVLLTFVVDDVGAWHRHLVASGVRVKGEPRLHQEIGVEGFFAFDPGGYQLEFQRFVSPAAGPNPAPRGGGPAI